MGEYIITGNKKLKGTVTVNGSKNAVLPILAATVLNGSVNILENCPEISDTNLYRYIKAYRMRHRNGK